MSQCRFFSFVSLFLFALLFHKSSQAQQKITLLTSIKTKPGFFFCCSSDYDTELEGIFRNNFKNSRYELEVIHCANQFDLWNTLHNPKNIAVFWLSHSGSKSNPETCDVFDFQKIIDFEGYEVTPVFEKIHPNLGVLSIIGCHSQGIVEKMLQTENNPHLKILDFPGTIEPVKGLKTSLTDAMKILNKPELRYGYPAECMRAKKHVVTAVRNFSYAEALSINRSKIIQPAARIMAGKNIVGIFPPAINNETYQSTEILIPATGELPDLRLDVGENSKILAKKDKVANLAIGRMRFFLKSFDGTEKEPWSIWQLAGKPIGVFANTYQVNDSVLKDISLKKSTVEDTDFSCESMPPY